MGLACYRYCFWTRASGVERLLLRGAVGRSFVVIKSGFLVGCKCHTISLSPTFSPHTHVSITSDTSCYPSVHTNGLHIPLETPQKPSASTRFLPPIPSPHTSSPPNTYIPLSPISEDLPYLIPDAPPHYDFSNNSHNSSIAHRTKFYRTFNFSFWCPFTWRLFLQCHPAFSLSTISRPFPHLNPTTTLTPDQTS